jgi:glycosyltransferase involved in cell wall biosynthesis
MRILFNCPAELIEAKNKKYSGGIPHFTEMFIQNARKSKHEYIALVFERGSKDVNKFKYRIVKKDNITWVIVNLWIHTLEIVALEDGTATEATKKTMSKLSELVMAQKPDLFFMNGLVALHYLVFLYAHKHRVPIVTIHHGLWFKELEEVKKFINKKSIRMRREIEANLAKYSAVNIFLSDSSLREYESALVKVPKKQVRILPSPYNEIFNNLKYPENKNKEPIKIGMVARWDKIKNHEAILELAKESKKRGLPWKFYTITQMAKSYPPYDALRDEYIKHIEVLPVTDPVGLKKFYQSMNIIVMPSRFETFSGVTMEALLQNKPVLISPAIPWAKIYKKHKLSKWIIDFKDPGKVIKLIQQNTNSTPPPKLLKYIVKTFNPKQVFKQYLKIFETTKQP